MSTCYSYESPVYFDELDLLGMLHNARYAAHVERATIHWFHEQGGEWDPEGRTNDDQFHAVRDFRIEFLAPLLRPGRMRIDLWVEKLGTTSCTYGFECRSIDGDVTHARGRRTIVKFDPRTRRSAPWSERFRIMHRPILREEAAA